MKDLLKPKVQPNMQTLGPQFKFALREDLKDKKEFLPNRAEPLATGWDVKAAWNNEDVSDIDVTKYKKFCDTFNFDKKLNKLYMSKTSGIVYECTKKKEIVLAFVPAGEYIKIPTGFKILAPEGWWVELKPRSSTFAKKHCHSLYGTIDNGFYNELLFAIQYLPKDNLYSHDHDIILTGNDTYDISYKNIQEEYLKIEMGEAIAQIIPVRLQHMDILEISNEEFDKATTIQKEKIKAQFGNVRDGGIGSTDKK